MSAASHRSPMPDTIMAAAFLRAFIAWAQRESGKEMVLPTGIVAAGELRQVIVALVCARRNT